MLDILCFYLILHKSLDEFRATFLITIIITLAIATFCGYTSFKFADNFHQVNKMILTDKLFNDVNLDLIRNDEYFSYRTMLVEGNFLIFICTWMWIVYWKLDTLLWGVIYARLYLYIFHTHTHTQKEIESWKFSQNPSWTFRLCGSLCIYVQKCLF
jgi:hypothetical protein